MPAYMIKPTHGYITIADQQYLNNIRDYYLFKNMNSVMKKIVVAGIDEQWLKRAKNIVGRYTNKTIVELMDWIYICYGQITLGELMKNQDTIQEMYHVEEPIEILFDHIKTGQESMITENSTFTDRYLADMGITQILATQEYTHLYCMWEIILLKKCT